MEWLVGQNGLKKLKMTLNHDNNLASIIRMDVIISFVAFSNVKNDCCDWSI